MASSIRVAVEGCGHGTLHSIYASVQESCRVKGWDGVDLLIIGGDFQAVRNKHDLNVTSMPEKYRRMGDFHEYYSGFRTAPYLTIFVGGNHEASNHLFELYYGGWVAPNIYYVGAANVLRLGPLRIAGISGIWKGYDYRKPHFERLPFNSDDTGSIYHVREVDVRKLLSLRTQVDIGISHDWPQGVEWLGDHERLFSAKNHFRADARDGKLGSIAARQCLERLRPPHWFSAHLHVKYAAVVKHPEYQQTSSLRHQQSRTLMIKEQDREQVSAWGNFHAQAQKEDAEENARALRNQEERKEQEERFGVRNGPKYTFNETFKQVKTNDNLGRAVTSVIQEDRSQATTPPMPQLDGCMESKVGTLKRRRVPSNTDTLDINIRKGDGAAAVATQKNCAETSLSNGSKISSTVVAKSPDKNADAIDVEMSSDEEPKVTPTQANLSTPPNVDGAAASEEGAPVFSGKNPDAIEVDLSDDEQPLEGNNTAQTSQSTSVIAIPTQTHPNARGVSGHHLEYTNLSTDTDEDGGMQLNPAATSFRPMASMASVLHDKPGGVPSRTTSHHSMEDLDLSAVPPEADHQSEEGEGLISDEMRAKLAEINPSFAKQERVETSPALPFPEAISNTVTQFLALDKCEPHREFLQLLEIGATSNQPENRQTRPHKLQYDPEWLAILRVFASELEVGGEPSDRVPNHRGDSYYRDRIIEEEDYIKKHVVEAGLIEVPENFTITAPIFDPNLQVDSREMPREVTNPQTSAFCAMLGIENPFDITEEERDARIAQGPRSVRPRLNFGGNRGGRGRGGFSSRGGGGRGGGRGGRGRARW